MELLRQAYGRHFDDFSLGRTYAHPWEVTVGQAEAGLFASSFLDAMPTFASTVYAQDLGFRERPLHPMLLFNLGLSFSEHDVGEQCLSDLGYLGLRFPRAVYPGDTLRASSTCVDLTPSADRSRGVVRVRTCVYNQVRQPVCWFDRKVLVPGGMLSTRPFERHPAPRAVPESVQSLPPELAMLPPAPERDFGFAGHFEDFAVGQLFCHQRGRRISEHEHQMLATLLRHPAAGPPRPSAGGGGPSAADRPRVLGSLVLAWAAALSSRDLCGNAVWELGYEDATHHAPVQPGDTLFAASKIIGQDSVAEDYGALHVRLVAVKNARPEGLLAEGHDLFKPERTKPRPQRIPLKVLEVTRHVLVRRRP